MKQLDMRQSLQDLNKKIIQIDKNMNWSLRLRIWVQEAKETRSFIEIRRSLATQQDNETNNTRIYR